VRQASPEELLDVLVVDDDPAVARLVRVMLEREGLVVGHAHDAAEACEILGRQPCRVVLTDYTMPDVNGLELVRRLDARGVRSAFLVMSAFLEPAVVDEICCEPAVAGMIRKPFELKELVLDVRSASGIAVESPGESSQPLPGIGSPLAESSPHGPEAGSVTGPEEGGQQAMSGSAKACEATDENGSESHFGRC
jgi:CheY-like chemotaxis protein